MEATQTDPNCFMRCYNRKSFLSLYIFFHPYKRARITSIPWTCIAFSLRKDEINGIKNNKSSQKQDKKSNL